MPRYCVINTKAACLGLSHMHTRMLPPGSVTVAYGSEAQLYEIKECTIVHFAATDATLTAYLPAHRMHEYRCKGPLCADSIGNSVGVWHCCVTGGRDEVVVVNWAVDFQPECHE